MMLWLGCELGQGYHYGRPVPAEELTAALELSRESIVTTELSAWRRISATNLDVSPTQRLAQLQAVYDGAPVGLAFVDQNLRYVNLNNKKLADMNGASVEKHLGSHVSEMIPGFFPQVEPYIRRALAGEPIADVEVKVPVAGDTRLLSYQPALDEAGEVVGVAIAVTEISKRKQMEDALKASEDHYRSMVELNPQVMWVMDPQGRNLDVSPRWNKSTGEMRPASLDHEWLRSVHPEDLQVTVRAITSCRESGSPIDVEYRVADGAGGWAWEQSIGSPRFDISGKIVCWYGSVQDIEGPSSLKSRLSSGPTDVSIMAPRTQGEVASDRQNTEDVRHLTLLDLEILDTLPEAEFDDLVILASEICGTPICLVSLIDSDRQWFKASIGLGISQTPLSSSFCAHAIEQQGLFLVEDATKDERFKANPLVLGEPRIRFYAGLPLYASGGVAVGALCVIDVEPRSLSPSQAQGLAILGQQVQGRMELRSERSKLLRAIDKNHNLTAELKQRNETLTIANLQLEQLARMDALTGLLNRRAFEERMDAEFANALARQSLLSILVMDIDDFKEVNDQFGHAAGDDILCHVGRAVQENLRAGDSAARVGGEEFVVILPESTTQQAHDVAANIQAVLACAMMACRASP